MIGKSWIVAALAVIALLACSSAPARGFIQDPALLDRIKPGVTTAAEVEQILGAPANRTAFPRLEITSMDYVMRIWTETYDVGVILGKDGVVREVQKLLRFVQRD
jgi:outer membrane protein assembly factor BamE (lipoprotein component of BamABCDE complex)